MRFDLRAAEQAIVLAELAATPAERYVAAQLAALRVAAAVVAQRSRPAAGRTDLWRVLGRAAPEYGEWAAYFGLTQRLSNALRAGEGSVGERQADDLLRDACTFRDQVACRAAAARGRDRGSA